MAVHTKGSITLYSPKQSCGIIALMYEPMRDISDLKPNTATAPVGTCYMLLCLFNKISLEKK